jgi:anti-sigma B factor antagonist
MQYTVKQDAGFDTLELQGEVDMQFSAKLKEQILASLKHSKALLIDMTKVSYIDSSGIAALVEGFQAAKSARLAYGLLNISSTVLQVLTMTRLDRVFNLYSSREQFVLHIAGQK